MYQSFISFYFWNSIIRLCYNLFIHLYFGGLRLVLQFSAMVKNDDVNIVYNSLFNLFYFLLWGKETGSEITGSSR